MKSKSQIRKKLAEEHPNLSEFEIAQLTNETFELAKQTYESGNLGMKKIVKNRDGETYNTYSSDGSATINNPLHNPNSESEE